MDPWHSTALIIHSNSTKLAKKDILFINYWYIELRPKVDIHIFMFLEIWNMSIRFGEAILSRFKFVYLDIYPISGMWQMPCYCFIWLILDKALAQIQK
jgi:hypothetical protein